MKIQMPSVLKERIIRLKGRGYKAYKELQGSAFKFSPLDVCFEHVQGDPFAQPTRLSVSLDLGAVGFPECYFDTPVRQLALEDFLLRELNRNIRNSTLKIKGTGKSGVIGVQPVGQAVLCRSGARIEDQRLTLIFFAGLPASGRSILEMECLRMFEEFIQPVWGKSLLPDALDFACIERSIATLEDFMALQTLLHENDWSAFVANGSLLPRAAGHSDLPLEEQAVLFQAPQGMSACVELPHAGRVEGMPIPKGIHLIVGGGFHGKSALLNAIQSAIHPHISGDGRERIATVSSAVKIRAEDGRPVQDIDLSGFMGRLPSVASTQHFTTRSASGSTSQAVNIIEAIESGSEFLLMDEDTCATNFMIRDARMQALIRSDMEPITPFLDRVEEIHQKLGLGILLVMGGCGDYFEPATQVIAMENYRPRWVTEEAKEIVKKEPGRRVKETTHPFPTVVQRRRGLERIDFSRGNKDVVIQTRGLSFLTLGNHEVDTQGLEQLQEEGQLIICGWVLRKLRELQNDSELSDVAGLRKIFHEIEDTGLTSIAPYNTGLFVLPRLYETLAVLNRIR
ncbi:MAG: hypothetical protein COV66_10505 [Nitrospinae bacterium CG11_big_fil_rev_8_21_14_0_20_45_15]|nr:MAG: hypothetical protein COV66_10505 [Nitrospinae bacterium CG11_big_fil_rev_8_21_14_0_20_45_15]